MARYRIVTAAEGSSRSDNWFSVPNGEGEDLAELEILAAEMRADPEYAGSEIKVLDMEDSLDRQHRTVS